VTLRELTPDLRALADIRLLRLEDGPGRGQRLLVARNAAGVGFEVAVDRGFDLAALSLDQIELGWHSPNQMRWPPPPPDGEGGFGFLRSFDGLLVTCGLDYCGPPRPGHPQHGQIWSAQGRLTGYGLDDGVLCCEGVLRQAAVYGHVLELHRRITLDLGRLTLRIRDRVTNQGFVRSPHARLYHVNFGWPLLDRDTRLTGFGDFAGHFAQVPPFPAPRRPRSWTIWPLCRMPMAWSASACTTPRWGRARMPGWAWYCNIRPRNCRPCWSGAVTGPAVLRWGSNPARRCP